MVKKRIEMAAARASRWCERKCPLWPAQQHDAVLCIGHIGFQARWELPVKALLASASPLSDSSSARDAGSKSANRVSRMVHVSFLRVVVRSRFRAALPMMGLGSPAHVSNLLLVRPRGCWGVCRPRLHREAGGQVQQEPPAVGLGRPASCPPNMPNRRHNVASRRIRAPGFLVRLAAA